MHMHVLSPVPMSGQLMPALVHETSPPSYQILVSDQMHFEPSQHLDWTSLLICVGHGWLYKCTFGPLNLARSGACGPRAARSGHTLGPQHGGGPARHGPLILFYMLWFCALSLWYNLWIEICFAWNNKIVWYFFHMLWYVKKLTFV